MDLQISNVFNISVAQAGQGVGRYNTSNLAIFTEEIPVNSFGADLFRLYLDPIAVGEDFGTNSKTYKMALAVFSQQPNILANNGYLAVVPMLLDVDDLLDETFGEAVARTQGLVQYFGAMTTLVAPIQATMLDDAAVIQTLNKMAFVVSRNPADIEVAGKLDKLRSGSLYRTRGLYYGSATDLEALTMMASYAGRALSVNFQGNLTTITMHLKDLVSVQPDPTMTQTLLNKAQAAGADTYVSIQGVPKTFCSKANRFFDRIYNLSWFIGELQVAMFNILAQTSTKIAQTEQGLDLMKSGQRAVCEQAVTNGYLAAGKWTDPTTFGNQLDFYANILQRGYYISSQSIADQLPSVRESRQAPLFQIAAKEAGAIHNGGILINVNP